MLTIVLIPSAALLITGACVAGYLMSEGLSARDYSAHWQQGVAPIVQVVAADAQERMISLRALGGDRQALAGLQEQWNATDAALASAAKVSNAAQSINPGAMASVNAAFGKLLAQLPAMRLGVRTRRVSAAEVDALYTRLINVGTPVLLGSALSAPGSAAAVDGITVLDLLPAFDLHSRAVGLGAGWVTSGVLSQSGRLMVAELAGAYRNQLQELSSRLTPSETAAYNRLVAGGAWQLATSGEDDLALRGKLAVPVASWLAAENTVSADLLGLWGDSFRQSENSAVAAANQTLSRAILLGSLVLALSIAAFITAIVLASGLVRRLRRLREQTLELADSKLPSMMARIADGELVGPESEMAMSDHGSDEIGQVAEAFNTAQRTAVAAAVAEARTRSGVNKVFLDIAHRSQMVVHRQLELLDVAEAKQNDPEHLELLFQLDHLATRARRNAENLLILGGGQPRRKWRRPEALEDIVRSAVSETEHFARVAAVRLPAVRVQGTMVGDLIHLLAELVDNATAFSPPDAAVTVHGNLVGKGVVVEVEDQGLGIEHAERERLNQTLANPPNFQEMALSGQRHLGLFVASQLAARHGIAVSLQESAYGGIKAIVLIPADVIEANGTNDGDLPALGRRGRHHQPEEALAEMAPGPVPRPRGRQDADPRRRQSAEPPPDPVRPSPPWPDVHAPAASPVPLDMVSGPHDPAPGAPRRSRAPLPRRERLVNLAPGLRQDTEKTSPGTAPRRTRSPEEARGSMAAFQRGTRLGRDSPGQDNRESEWPGNE